MYNNELVMEHFGNRHICKPCTNIPPDECTNSHQPKRFLVKIDRHRERVHNPAKKGKAKKGPAKKGTGPADERHSDDVLQSQKKLIEELSAEIKRLSAENESLSFENEMLLSKLDESDQSSEAIQDVEAAANAV